MKMMEYRGAKYEESFGKLVRKLDREQAKINEDKRYAYFCRREDELEKKYDKIYKKMLFEEGVKDDDRNPKAKKIYREAMDMMQEQIIKEWKAKGYTDRDWTKMKMLVFDGNNNIKVITAQ